MAIQVLTVNPASLGHQGCQVHQEPSEEQEPTVTPGLVVLSDPLVHEVLQAPLA